MLETMDLEESEIVAKRKAGVDKAVELGYTKEDIARSIGTSGANLAKILERGSKNSRFAPLLDRWLDVNAFRIGTANLKALPLSQAEMLQAYVEREFVQLMKKSKRMETLVVEIYSRWKGGERETLSPLFEKAYSLAEGMFDTRVGVLDYLHDVGAGSTLNVSKPLLELVKKAEEEHQEQVQHFLAAFKGEMPGDIDDPPSVSVPPKTGRFRLSPSPTEDKIKKPRKKGEIDY